MKSSSTAAKPVTYVVPFSHLDLFWAGSREECLSRGNSIIRHALELLEKHEDFRFLLETMNFVDHYLSCFPAEKARIGRLVESGRLELGPLWSGIYQNLPGGETLCRNIMLARDYARTQFAATPTIAHFGDLPGYTPQYPQIAAKAGLTGVLLSRGGPGSTPLFRWRALDGSETTAYYALRGYAAYHHLAGDYEALTTQSFRGGPTLECTLAHDAEGKSYPLLIHWGMDLFCPTQLLVDNVRRWNREQASELRFCTLTEYFARVAGSSALPSLAGELPAAWPNIESSWPDIWPEDLPAEAALHMAEFLASLCRLRGWQDYPAALLTEAWKALLDGMDHNQNSQGGDTADRDKLQLKRWARGTAERISTQMAWRLAAQVKAPHDLAFPVVVFNSLGWRRSGVVAGRAAVYGPLRPWDHPGREPKLRLVDASGQTVPYVQLQRYQCLSSALEIAFPVHEVPAAGYRVYYLVAGENPGFTGQTCTIALDADADAAGPQRNQGRNRYENRFLRLEIDTVTGEASLFDRQLERPLFTRLGLAAVEERRGNYISNMAPSGRNFPAVLKDVRTLDNNGVWCRIQVRGEVYGMPCTQTYTLFHDFPDLLLENEIDWQEPRWIRVQQHFALPDPAAAIRYAVPFGQVTFPETLGELSKNCDDELDLELRRRLRLCRQWVDVGNETAGISIGCDHRMWEFEDGLLRSYLVRGAGFCGAITVDPEGRRGNIARPPAGKYRFQYLLRPRHGSLAATASYRCGWELNHPPRLVAGCDPNPAAAGASAFSLLDFSAGSLVVTAIKQAESGRGFVVRVFETAGQAVTTPLPRLPGYCAAEAGITEDEIRPISGNTLSFKPFEIKTLLFQPVQA